jgi:hypothetical protein
VFLGSWKNPSPQKRKETKQMKKRIVTLAITLLLATTFTSCASSKEKTAVTSHEVYSYADDDLRVGDIREYANTENGFYFMNGNLLCYYDNQVKEATVVCTDANCEHRSMDCNAMLSYSLGGIYYNNGNLYTIEHVEGEDGNYHFYLTEISKDATRRTRLTDLFQSKSTAVISYDMILHRGYCYFTVYPDNYEVEKENHVFRVKIEENSKVETIYSDTGYGVTFTLYGYGDNIYLNKSKNADAQASDFTHVMYMYNTNTGEISDCGVDEFRRVTFGNGCMYYTKADSVWKKEIGKKEKKIYDFEKDIFGLLRFDGTYLYFDSRVDYYMKNLEKEERQVYVLDQQGTLVDLLEIPFNYEFVACDGEKTIWRVFMQYEFGFFYTEQIGNKDANFEKINVMPE